MVIPAGAGTRDVLISEEDLTTACGVGLAAARGEARPITVRWGAIEFDIEPGDTLERAHQRFFAAAKRERETRASKRLAERRVLRDFFTLDGAL